MLTTVQSSASISVMHVPENRVNTEPLSAAQQEQAPPVSPVGNYEQEKVKYTRYQTW